MTATPQQDTTPALRHLRRALAYAGPIEPLSGGRVNHVWRMGDRVAKLFRAGAATPLFPNDPDVEWAALRALAGTGIAPAPLMRITIEPGPVLIYRHIVGPSAVARAGDVARILGRLHRITAPQSMPRGATGPNILATGAAMIDAGDPLHLHRPAPPPDPPWQGFIHRDPVPTNIIAAGQATRLIDFQCPALGDPAEDLAHYLSPAMQILYGDGPLSGAEIARFLAAYPDPAITAHYRRAAPALHWRMACYCQWQVDRGTMIYAGPRDAELAYLSQLSG